jgi:hypothetical protein
MFREDRDEYIKNTMRDNMQLFVNALWQVSSIDRLKMKDFIHVSGTY